MKREKALPQTLISAVQFLDVVPIVIYDLVWFSSPLSLLIKDAL